MNVYVNMGTSKCVSAVYNTIKYNNLLVRMDPDGHTVYSFTVYIEM